MNTPLSDEQQGKINDNLYPPIKEFLLIPAASNFEQSQARNNTQRQARQKPNRIVRNGNDGKRKPQKINRSTHQKG